MHNFPRIARVATSSVGVFIALVVAVAGIAVAKPFAHRQSLNAELHQLAIQARANTSTTDSDHDGLTNLIEVKRTRTNPRKADSDGDGLSDWTEVKHTKTNPRKADSDDDGVNDGDEIAAGTDPWNPVSFPVPGQPPTDTTPPNTSITSAPPATTTETSASFSFSSTESGSTFQCKLDSGAFASCTSPKSYSGLAVGAHSFEVRATDAAGNVDASPAAKAWTVESFSSSAVEAVWAAPANAEADVPVTLDGTASNGDAPLDCTWSFENQSGSVVWGTRDGCVISFTFEESGTKYVRLIVEGPGGETDSNKQTFVVDPPSTPPPPDTTPPNTSITSAPPATTTETSASFSFSSTESGSTFQCKLDSGAFASCTSPKSYSGLAVGAHSFEVRATDAAGNVDASPAAKAWTVESPSTPPPPDTTPPNTSITSAPPATTTETSASFSFSSTESGSTFQCKLDSGAFASCTSPKSYSGLAVGAHSFEVRATDAAGNVDASPATKAWTVESPSTPPPPTAGCVTGATQATTAAQVRSAVQGSHNVCVTADVGDVNLDDLGSRPVVVSTDGGSMGYIDLNETKNLTIRNARFRSTELWYANGTTIEDSVIGGTQASRTYDNLININVSPDVTIRHNELAWTLAGTSGFAGYAIRSPGNSLGPNERLKIERNYIHNIAADGIQGLGNGQNVVIDRNRFDYIGQEPASDEHSDAMQIIDHGPNTRITNNWVSHEGYFAAGQVSGGSGTLYVHGGDNDTLLIENNLFTDSQGRILFAGGLAGPETISNLTFRRNTVLNVGLSYTGFPGLHWSVQSGSNNLLERNVAQDTDGGFANEGSLAAATWVENLWRNSSASNALTIDASGNCTSAACNPSGQEAIGYRKPSGVDW